MASLTQTRDAAVETLRRELPGTRVEGVAGSSEVAAILRESIGAGAVFVMALSAANAVPEDSLDFDLLASCAALVIVHGRKNQTAREADGLKLAEKVARALHGKSFGPGFFPARLTGMAPVEDDELLARGLWAWGVTWEQRISLG